jgi:hypothetical protein
MSAYGLDPPLAPSSPVERQSVAEQATSRLVIGEGGEPDGGVGALSGVRSVSP